MTDINETVRQAVAEHGEDWFTFGDYEYSELLPEQYGDSVAESTVVLAISACGGGTVGETYADQRWSYCVNVDGRDIITGEDLRSGGMPATHADMLRSLCSFLSADAEHFTYGHYGDGDGPTADYGPDAVAFLIDASDRLSLMDIESTEV